MMSAAQKQKMKVAETAETIIAKTVPGRTETRRKTETRMRTETTKAISSRIQATTIETTRWSWIACCACAQAK